MTPQEMRERDARGFLADAFEAAGQPEAAHKLRTGVMHGRPFVAAIIAAQDAERERAAGIADSFDHGEPIQRGEAERYDTARKIAAAIRNEGDPT